MISLITRGPIFGYAFAAPVPLRNVVIKLVGSPAWTVDPKLKSLIATKSTPTLVSNLPKDTPFSAAPKLMLALYPVSAPAVAGERYTSSPFEELKAKGNGAN